MQSPGYVRCSMRAGLTVLTPLPNIYRKALRIDSSGGAT